MGGFRLAWLTKISTDEQVEYRLKARAGCDLVVEVAAELAEGADPAVAYRTQQEGETPLVWMGSGLGAVGLSAGQVLDEDGKEAARRLMNGCHPLTGARLFKSRTSSRAHPEAKLTVARVTAAIEAAAAEKGVEPAELLAGKPKQERLLAQQQRMVNRFGEGHRLQVATLDKLVRAAGLDLADIFTEAELAKAREHQDERVDTRTRGFDLVLDIPKSDSVLIGLLPDEAEARYRELVHQASREALALYEKWIGYAVGGEDGELVRLATGGLLAWSTEHRSARPVGDGTPGDPHLHLHISIANLALCEDGQWRSVAASGRDMYRHASAIDGFFKARVRALTHEAFGVVREQNERTGAWEVTGIPAEVRDAYSRRAKKVVEVAGEGASREEMARASADTRRAKHATGSAEMRESWRERAVAMGVDVEAMLAAAAPGPPGPDGGLGIDGPGGGPRIPPPADLAAIVFDPETGLTASRKDFDRAQLLAAVANALPHGLGADIRDLDRLADDVLRVEGYAVALPHVGSTLMSSTDRYTTRDVLDAEDVAVTQAKARFGDGSVVLTGDQAEAALSIFEVAAGFALSAEQREVVTRLLTAGNGVEAVIGTAGAGKSTLMDACRIAWDATGTTYAGACLSAVGAKGLEDASAIPSKTVAAWLQQIETGTGLSGIDALVLDEAVMTDDRSMAKLLTEAARTGTQLIAIGDPKQLQAIGIGGAFAEIHRLVDGLTLTENRRQQDAAERQALDVWRTGDHAQALAMLAAGGRVHAVETAEAAREEMLTAWDELRRRWPDELDMLEQLVVLAARNNDVDLLNAGAQQIRRAAGELGDSHTYAMPGGAELTLAENDVVRVRANDYRSRRGEGPDVLNGYRAVVTDIDAEHRVRIEWRAKDRTTDAGWRAESAWMKPEDIAAGSLSLGYAMTVAASQGLTCDTSLLYGLGANAFAAYPGLTRGREANHLWLPLAAIEDEATQARLGAARTETELLHRATAAFAQFLGQSRPDAMVSDELRARPEPAVLPQQVEYVAARDDAEAALRQAEPVPPQRQEADHVQARQETEKVLDRARAVSARAARSKSSSVTRARALDAARRDEKAAQLQEAQRRREAQHGEASEGAIPEDLSAEQWAQIAEMKRLKEMREVTPWQQRPYGDLTDKQLEYQLADLLKTAREQDEEAAKERAKYQELAALLSAEKNSGQTRGQRRAAELTEIIVKAEKCVATAIEEERNEAAAEEGAKKARANLDALGPSRKAGHISLALVGSTKKQVREAVAKYTSERMACDDEAQRARSAGRDAIDEAWRTVKTGTTASVFGFNGYAPRPANEEFARQLAELRTERLPQLGQNMDTRDLRKLGDHNGAAEAAAGQSQTTLTRAASVRTEQQLRTTMASRYGELNKTETAARTELAQARYTAELQRQERQQRQNEEAAAAYTPPPQQSRGSSYGL